MGLNESVGTNSDPTVCPSIRPAQELERELRMTRRERRVSSLTIAANGLFLLAAAVIGYAAWSMASQNRALIESLAEIRRPGALEDQLGPGDALPDVPLASLDGADTTTAQLAQRARVVAVLTTTCPFCEQSLAAWDEVARQLDAQGMGFAGISLHSPELTQAYVRDHEIGWPLLVIDATAKPRLGVRAVPRTLVLGEDGVIDQVVSGRFDQEDGETVLETLGLTGERK